MAFLAGILYTAVGILKLGWLTNFLSHSVISGFMSGASVIIALSQVQPCLAYSATCVMLYSFRLLELLNTSRLNEHCATPSDSFSSPIVWFSIACQRVLRWWVLVVATGEVDLRVQQTPGPRLHGHPEAAADQLPSPRSCAGAAEGPVRAHLDALLAVARVCHGPELAHPALHHERDRQAQQVRTISLQFFTNDLQMCSPSASRLFCCVGVIWGCPVNAFSDEVFGLVGMAALQLLTQKLMTYCW